MTPTALNVSAIYTEVLLAALSFSDTISPIEYFIYHIDVMPSLFIITG
jgi:hypothetical protein